MRKTIAFFVVLAMAQVAHAQSELPTKEQYYQQQILSKDASIGNLLDEVAKLRGEIKVKDAEIDRLKKAEAPKPQSPK